MRLAPLGAVALVLGSLGIFGARACFDPSVPFVRHRDGAQWITAPGAVHAELQQWGEAEAPTVVFTPGAGAGPRRAGRGAQLHVEVLGHVRVQVGERVLYEGANRHATVPLDTEALQAPLRIAVESLRGPALLWARTENVEPPLSTSPSWRVSIDGEPRGPARIADDTRPLPPAPDIETPREALGRVAPVLLALAALGAGAFVAVRRGALAPFEGAVPGLTLLAIGLAWFWLYARKFALVPLYLGYDADGHVRYIEFLVNRGSLPLATDGWATYHPPLFYLLASGFALLGPATLHLLPWLAGFATVLMAFVLARTFFPADPRVALLAAAFAATLPMNLTQAAYVSNEGLHAALVGGALVLTVRALLAPRLETRLAVAVAALFGLAALTKFTALAVACVALFFVCVKLVYVEKRGARTALRVVGPALTVFAAVAGWFYARNLLVFGTPLVGNWNLPGDGRVWWQQPGFHTGAYYTGFGEALRQPYLAGFHSFWDGLWSTLWGDGGIGGQAALSFRPEAWNYDFMSAGYLLAIPVAGLCAAGALRLANDALRGDDARRRVAVAFVLTSGWALLFSIAFLTLSLPFFAQAKAFYGLCMAAPLSLCFAAGVTLLDDALVRWRAGALRALLAGLLSASLGAFFLGYAA